MNKNLDKIHNLIHTCSETNIKLAFQLAISEKISTKELVEPWSELFRLRTTYTSGPRGKNIEEKLIDILSSKEIYAKDYGLLKVPKNIHLLKNMAHLYLKLNHIKDFPIPPNSFPSLKSLDLRENKLSAFPSQLSKISQLYSLYLDDNMINSIPEEIKDFQQLSYLSLNYCNLSKIHKNIAYLKKLDSISLADNYLSALPDSFCDLPLSECDLSNNEMTILPKNIGHMKFLKLLTLDGNPIPYKEIKRLKEVLPQCSIKV